MIFTNQALALFPPALGQAIAHTQRDRQELVEEICCRIGQVPVLLTQAHAYPAECRAILAGDLDYLLERATGASVYAAGEQIRQGYLQTAGGCRVGLCGCAYGQAAGQIDGIRQLSSVSVRMRYLRINGNIQIILNKIGMLYIYNIQICIVIHGFLLHSLP